jgi:hypothetical protein
MENINQDNISQVVTRLEIRSHWSNSERSKRAKMAIEKADKLFKIICEASSKKIVA